MSFPMARHANADFCDIEILRKAFTLKKKRKKGFSLTSKITLLGEEITLKEELPVLSLVLVFLLLALFL